VGSSYINMSQMHAFSWTQTGGMIDLGTLGANSFAVKANDKGQVVGGSVTTAGDQHAVLWNPVVDTTLPVITVPPDMTRDATSPAGATVEFTASATDENPTSPAVTCVPPSGNVFPIGTTPVECTATDDAGNTATASFTVTVKGASEQLADLLRAVTGVGPGTSLADKVKVAQTAYAAGDQTHTCEILNAFVNQVRAQAGKGIEPETTAPSLIADAKRIRAVLGC
jgi:probable HAF family extracellular repeat protein